LFPQRRSCGEGSAAARRRLERWSTSNSRAGLVIDRTRTRARARVCAAGSPPSKPSSARASAPPALPKSPRCSTVSTAVHRPGALRRAVARPARRAAHRPQFLLRRQPRRAHPDRLGTRQEVGREPAAAPLPGSRRPAALAGRSASGAPPTCAPAATTSRRPWPSSARSPSGTPARCASPATRSSRSPSSAGRASMSPCASPVSSAMPSRQQIALFDKAVRAIGALDEPDDQTTPSPPACAPRRSALMRDGATEPRPRCRPATASSARSPAPMARGCRP
jgi:hypothetical protein